MMHSGIHLLMPANKHFLGEPNLRQIYPKKQFDPCCPNLKNQNQSKIAEIRRPETLLSKRQIYEKIFSNFVAFSQFLNFTTIACAQCSSTPWT